MDEWIKCSEKLPDVKAAPVTFYGGHIVRVLGYFEACDRYDSPAEVRDCVAVEYDNDGEVTWMFQSTRDGSLERLETPPTHWMPRPAPPADSKEAQCA